MLLTSMEQHAGVEKPGILFAVSFKLMLKYLPNQNFPDKQHYTKALSTAVLEVRSPLHLYPLTHKAPLIVVVDKKKYKSTF